MGVASIWQWPRFLLCLLCNQQAGQLLVHVVLSPHCIDRTVRTFFSLWLSRVVGLGPGEILTIQMSAGTLCYICAGSFFFSFNVKK